MKVSKILGVGSAVASNLYLVLGFVSTRIAAQVTPEVPNSPLGDQKFLDWVKATLDVVIGLAALVSVAILIAAGYSYITAAGDETKIEKATKALTYAIVGLVICFIAVILVQFVLNRVLKQNT